MKKRRSSRRGGARASPAPSLTPGPQSESLSIEFAPAGQWRIRKIISRAAPRPTTKYFSLRLDRYVHCESALEADVAELLDASPAVETYAEQAMLLTYTMDGEIQRHYPDFFVRTATRRIVLEVKFRKTITADDVRRAEHLTPLLAALGFEYFLIDESHTQQDAYLENARFLIRRGRVAPSEMARAHIMHYIRTHGMTLQDAANRAWLGYVSWMALKGDLKISMAEPFAYATPIQLPESTEEGTLWALALLA